MFRLHNPRIEEKGAQVLGISCDHVNAHRAWGTALGGIPFPELSDWHPHGEVTKAYDLWNPDRGVGRRAVLVVDKGGVVRHRREYEPGTLPDPAELFDLLDELNR